VAAQDQAITKNYLKSTILQEEIGSSLALNSGYGRSMKKF
jgi:hypothetical protein